ncbi:hypothetical protein POPTR_014G051300v4 [Populus trichocarpa]|uniref:PPIase cyclophilin-type domain-containing protein n=1 Tax=Populus trichocarpa TaxID=3694 RepID=A0A3N7FXL2_POPTR|nr:uncharacterized protein LOC18105094 isoform X4 [Populus trichocarpa]RQO99746.1 hypothetical protein POPTR_014G051300v4 [Populus trichocarpa]|eukprot:XP_024440387.1 uncharacterized protein LOC18105094 isoform X4 [Populus trichocarpa]
MGRKQTVPELGRYGLLALFVMGTISCCMVYLCFSALFRPPNSNTEFVVSKVSDGLKSEDADGDCCRGIEHLELWGDAVKWGSEFKVNSSKACCLACKGMCSGDSGPCLCDSWVFCGDKQACGDKFGECWLKKQKDTLEPDRLDSGDHVMWTSGIVFGRGEGIIGLETEYGTLHLKAPYGPPFALIQGTLGASGTIFEDIPTEACPTIRRGSVAWVESGPEFFISLANHNEWSKAYTVFGFVLPEDMEIVERIAQLPTKPEVWGNINVAVLENPVPLHVRRIKRSAGNQKLYTN